MRLATEEQKKVYVDFIENLYGILRELRDAASEGGDRDLLGRRRARGSGRSCSYTDEVWTSDNTDAFDRLSIQDGFTYAYTPRMMMAWVTDSPNVGEQADDCHWSIGSCRRCRDRWAWARIWDMDACRTLQRRRR